MRGATPPLPNTLSWRGALLKAQGQLELTRLPKEDIIRNFLNTLYVYTHWVTLEIVRKVAPVLN
jgi:hypothetical protein